MALALAKLVQLKERTILGFTHLRSESVTNLASLLLCVRRAFSRSVAMQAEAAPWDSWGSDDYGPEIAKLQAEAEERLEKKISELMANIDKAGVEAK